VTAGGVKLSEVDAPTMESRKVTRPSFFAGEILDVDRDHRGVSISSTCVDQWVDRGRYRSRHVRVWRMRMRSRENGADGNGVDGNGVDPITLGNLGS